ncbi:MAG: glycosyltransferase, partial [Candidatus Competibacterales bacterium]|nr:glycosyltransferase [Candidatus Competibacterales bacterium]
MPTNWKRSIRRVAAESLALFFRGARWLHRDAFYWQRCEDPSYWLWLRRHRRPVASALPTGAGPRFSILLPAHDTRPAWLRETVDSVRAQSRGDWELIVVDDASPDPASRATLDALPDRDPRIRLLRHPVNRGIAASTNHAAESARGEWLLLLDHDDLLCPDTLAALAAGAEAHPEAGLLYTDEDRLSPRGLRYRPHFKPGFSPSRLEMCNYILHPLCVRRTVWQAHGGMRPRFDGSQDYDLLLRLWDAGVGFAHVPGVYYTWRESPDSMAGGADKPHIFAAGRAALGEHLRRRGETAEVGDNPETELGDYRIIFPRPATLRLGVIGGPPDLPLPAGWSLERLETLDGP